MKSNFLENVGTGTLLAGGMGLLIFISPILGVVIGWFCGIVIKWIFGSYITNGLNLVFNTTRFNAGQLPMICATLSMIGSFFRSTQTNNKDK